MSSKAVETLAEEVMQEFLEQLNTDVLMDESTAKVVVTPSRNSNSLSSKNNTKTGKETFKFVNAAAVSKRAYKVRPYISSSI